MIAVAKNLLTFLACLLAVSLQSFAVEPTISAASLSGSTLTISGANFGTKSTAAPHRFFPLLTETNGTISTSIAGIDSAGSTVAMEQRNNDYPADLYVVTGDATWGKSLEVSSTVTATYPDGGFTPAMGSFLPAGTNKVYASFWIKISYTGTTPTHNPQLKQPRAGVYGASPVSNGNNNYNATGVKIHAEMYPQPSGAMTIDSSFTPFWNDSNNVAYDYSNGSPNEVGGWSAFRAGFNFWSTWHYVQVLYDTGTIGAADGRMYWWWDGALVGQLTSKAIRLGGSTANPIQHFQFLTGFQLLDPGATYTIDMSRMYLDTTESRAEICNASTYAARTGCISLRATSWSTGSIGSDLQVLAMPSGYSYVYVTNAAGETNAAGFSYTAAVTTPTETLGPVRSSRRQMFRNSVRNSAR